MRTTNRRLAAAVVSIAAMVAWTVSGLGAAGDPIALSKVPEKSLKAAEAVADGMQIRGARLERTDRGVIYHIRGLVNGRSYNIVVKSDGEVVRIEVVTPAADGGQDGEKDKIPDQETTTPSKGG